MEGSSIILIFLFFLGALGLFRSLLLLLWMVSLVPLYFSLLFSIHLLYCFALINTIHHSKKKKVMETITKIEYIELCTTVSLTQAIHVIYYELYLGQIPSWIVGLFNTIFPSFTTYPFQLLISVTLIFGMIFSNQPILCSISLV